MKHDTDQLLQQALSPQEEPDSRLNQRILQHFEEEEHMKLNKKRIPFGILAAAFVLLVGSISVFAAWRYLKPDEVADMFEDSKLAEAFRGEDAVYINETQEYGGYRVTLLGVTSGRSITDHPYFKDDILQDDQTYIVVALENADNTPLPSVSDENYGEISFFVSPIIQGLNPAFYNVMSMGGAYTEYVVDGIQYRLVSCDNVEMFADRNLYLCVSDTPFYAGEAFIMDEATGEFYRNGDYSGLNAVFRLPLDETKADPAAAEAYIESLGF